MDTVLRDRIAFRKSGRDGLSVVEWKQDKKAASEMNQLYKEVYPREEPHVREDVKKTLPLRIDEPLYLKLKFIAEHTPYSMNSFILDRVIDEIEEEIARLTE